MGDMIDEALEVPIYFIVMALMDYVAWAVFWQVAGWFAILYMGLLLTVEFFMTVAWIRDKLGI